MTPNMLTDAAGRAVIRASRPRHARIWMALALAMGPGAPAVGASAAASVLDLPVAGRVTVPASAYRGMPAASATPVNAALAVAGPFDGKLQLVVQANPSAESPSASRVTLIRDGLLDDAVRSERWDVEVTRTQTGTWEVRQVTKAWRCWRGPKQMSFGAEPCP